MGNRNAILGAVLGGIFGGPAGAAIGGAIGGLSTDKKLADEQRQQGHQLMLQEMRQAIVRAATQEQEHHLLNERIRSSSLRDKAELNVGSAILRTSEAERFIRTYVEETPTLLEAMEKAATKPEVLSSVLPVLNGAEAYFYDTNNIIPNDQGILGLFDDAYLARRLVEELGNQLVARGKQPFVDINLGPENDVARELLNILSPKTSDALNARVKDSLQNQGLSDGLKTALLFGAGAAALLVIGGMFKGSNENKTYYCSGGASTPNGFIPFD